MSLKEILGEELYNKVIEKAGDKKIAVISDGKWIPKDKFDSVNEEKKEYKKQVDDLNTKLDELNKSLKDNKEATETIEKLKKQIADTEIEMANIRKTNAIKLAVLKEKPRDIADILPHLKVDSISLQEDGSITGLKEQVDHLKETKNYLFIADESTPDGTGGSIGNSGKPKPPQPKSGIMDILQKANIRK